MAGNGHIPLISLYGNLIVSIQISLTDGIVEALQNDVTRAIERSDVSGLIIDLSGVDLMDSFITRCIRDLALTARLMGVRTVVCGLRPAVVMTLVEMGLDVPGVTSALNLEHALEHLLAQSTADEQGPWFVRDSAFGGLDPRPLSEPPAAS
jgi:rsbT antagonist protein RsbS